MENIVAVVNVAAAVDSGTAAADVVPIAVAAAVVNDAVNDVVAAAAVKAGRLGEVAVAKPSVLLAAAGFPATTGCFGWDLRLYCSRSRSPRVRSSLLLLDY